VSNELSDDVIREWTRHTRAAQGLGPKITDPATLNRIITIAFGPTPQRPTAADVDQVEQPPSS
jgi:hypothetical protein